MSPRLRILLVGLTLVSGLREAGAAACASACPMPERGMALAAESCCGPCPAAEECPLFAPAPPALVERAPIPARDPDHSPPVPSSVRAAVPDAFGPEDAALRPRPSATALPVRASPRPLWLLDRGLLI